MYIAQKSRTQVSATGTDFIATSECKILLLKFKQTIINFRVHSQLYRTIASEPKPKTSKWSINADLSKHVLVFSPYALIHSKPVD